MAITWPVSLPQVPLREGAEEAIGDARLRTNMDVGPAKVRRRMSLPPKRLVYPLLLTEAQVATFETFWTTTLAGGSLAFELTHPRKGTTASVRIVAEPKWTQFGEGPDGTGAVVPKFLLTLELEILP